MARKPKRKIKVAWDPLSCSKQKIKGKLPRGFTASPPKHCKVR